MPAIQQYKLRHHLAAVSYSDDDHLWQQLPPCTLANIKIGDIVNNNKSIMTHAELTNKYKLVVDPWRWMAIISAIPKEWKNKIKKNVNYKNA